ncbi:unnamed protein product [Arctogadus glacialis]
MMEEDLQLTERDMDWAPCPPSKPSSFIRLMVMCSSYHLLVDYYCFHCWSFVLHLSPARGPNVWLLASLFDTSLGCVAPNNRLAGALLCLME